MPRPHPRYEPPPRFLPHRRLILQGDLETALDRLGPAGAKHHLAQGAAAIVLHDGRQFVQRVGGEIIAVAMRDLRHLGRHRRVDLGIAMAQTIDRRPARPVDILLAIGIPQIAAHPAHHTRQGVGGLQVQRQFGTGHGGPLCRHHGAATNRRQATPPLPEPAAPHSVAQNTGGFHARSCPVCPAAVASPRLGRTDSGAQPYHRRDGLSQRRADHPRRGLYRPARRA